MIRNDLYILSKDYSKKTDIDTFFRIILFPKVEHGPLKRRLGKNKKIYTIRVEEEYNKYSVGEILETEWEDLITVTNIEKITNIDQYRFYDKIGDDVKEFLSKYNELDVVELEMVTDIYILLLNKIRKIIINFSNGSNK